MARGMKWLLLLLLLASLLVKPLVFQHVRWPSVFNQCLFNVFGGPNYKTTAFSILFMTFFFLKDADLFYKIVIAVTPDSKVDHIKNIMENSSKLLTRYFSGLIVQVSIVTMMISTGLAVIGVENAILLAK